LTLRCMVLHCNLDSTTPFEHGLLGNFHAFSSKISTLANLSASVHCQIAMKATDAKDVVLGSNDDNQTDLEHQEHQVGSKPKEF
jgi:hypothetical protein